MNKHQIFQADPFRVKSEGIFPDDIDVSQPFFHSSDVDITQILSDSSNIENIDFGSLVDQNNVRGKMSFILSCNVKLSTFFLDFIRILFPDSFD